MNGSLGIASHPVVLAARVTALEVQVGILQDKLAELSAALAVKS